MDKNVMLEQVRDSYLNLAQQSYPKSKKERASYNLKMLELTIAGQCLIACGAEIKSKTLSHFDFDINEFWPNFLYLTGITNKSNFTATAQRKFLDDHECG
jgi:hypothetical protein